MHVFVQMVCALVKPTIMARKMVRASRGTDPKRPAEPRRAESRHDREAARAHIVSVAGAKEEESERSCFGCAPMSSRQSRFADGDLSSAQFSSVLGSEMPADETRTEQESLVPP